MVDLKPFKANIERARRESVTPEYSDPREGFRAELTAAGFEPPKVLDLGRIHRIAAPGERKGKKSGWCIYNEFADERHEGRAFGVGTYGDWRSTVEKTSWTSKSTSDMTGEERSNYLAQLETARAMQEAERRERQDAAAKEAYALWESAPDATADNPYLKRKGVAAYPGVKETGDCLLIPVTVDGQLTSIQFIKNEGVFPWIDTNKNFFADGRKKGCYFVIEGNNDRIFITEGYATAATIHAVTGNTVYVCFDTGNLYEVANHVCNKFTGSLITIAGDDDRFTRGNPGRTKASQAADGLGIASAFPAFLAPECEDLTDFNDMAKEQGIAAVRAMFEYKPQLYTAPVSNIEQSIVSPPGMLGEIAKYYNTTAGNSQPLFAVQTAIAIASLVCARNFETNLSNRSSLFLINIAKSGTGKEHAKKIMEKILDKCNLGRLIAGDGYTSGSAVISALQDKPRHITTIDEFSKYLQAAQNKYGSSHLMEANTQLMQAVGRLDGVMRPKSYATIGQTKERKKELADMKVINPAITLLAMTTPDDLFETIDLRSIKDGFLNRFIVCISDAERAIRQHKEPVDVPQSIIDWVEAVEARRGNAPENAADEPAMHTLYFTAEAMQLQTEFQQFCIDHADRLEKMGMSEISGRSNEMAMRLSLIVALAMDPQANEIDASAMAWAINWVKHHLDQLIERLKMTVASSQHEADKKEILKAIRHAHEGVTWTSMQKTSPYSKHKAKDLKDILIALKDAELIIDEPFQNGGKGRPTIIYKATA